MYSFEPWENARSSMMATMTIITSLRQQHNESMSSSSVSTAKTASSRRLVGGVLIFLLTLVLVWNGLVNVRVETTNEATSLVQARDSSALEGLCHYITANRSIEEPDMKRFDRSLFLHVGKAAGGSIKYRLKHEWRLIIPPSHPRPRMDRIAKFGDDLPWIVINIRDPIDRYESAYNWGLLSLCDLDGDNRTAGEATKDIDRWCYDSQLEESEILFHKYERSANLMAELLYDERKGQETRQDLTKVRHAGNPLVEWMAFD